METPDLACVEHAVRPPTRLAGRCFWKISICWEPTSLYGCQLWGLLNLAAFVCLALVGRGRAQCSAADPVPGPRVGLLLVFPGLTAEPRSVSGATALQGPGGVQCLRPTQGFQLSTCRSGHKAGGRRGGVGCAGGIKHKLDLWQLSLMKILVTWMTGGVEHAHGGLPPGHGAEMGGTMNACSSPDWSRLVDPPSESTGEQLPEVVPQSFFLDGKIHYVLDFFPLNGEPKPILSYLGG